MSADASASMELEGDDLASGLDQIAQRFAEIAGQINTQFAAANGQLTRTATSAQAIGAASPGVASFSAALVTAANTGRLVYTVLSQISRTASLIAPLIKYLPDSMGSWVPKLKAVAAEHVHTAAKISLVTKAAAAVSGRLTVLQAGFAALELRELGATRAATAFGVTSALALSKTISAARLAASSVGMLGGVLARTTVAAGRGFGAAFGGFGRTASTLTTLAAPMAGLALTLGPVGAAAIGVASGFSMVGKSISAAANTQGLETSFVTLLGSADAARKRMQELSTFAASTPFEIPSIAKASRTLQTLTNGALSTGPGLRMVGDAAALTQQPIEELAVHFGRLYDGLMNGRPVGESASRLQELGLISSATRGRIEALQKEGAKGGDVWKIAAAELGRFSGEMERQSGTWNGMLSNLSDSVGNLFREFGAPIITALTPFLQRLLAWLGTLTQWATRAGQIFAGWSAVLAQVFSDGRLLETLARVGKLAFMEIANFALGALVGVGNGLFAVLGGAAKLFVSLISEATKGDFWRGLGNALKSAGAALLALLLEGVAKALDMLRDLPKIGGKAGAAADKTRGFAESMAATSADAASRTGAPLAPLFARWNQDARTILGNVAEAFQSGRSSVGNIFDTDAARKDFLAFMQPTLQRADAAVKSAQRAAAQGSLPPPITSTDATTAGGKAKADVAGLQKIGGGGGFSIGKADPLLAENRTQTSELRGMRSDIKTLQAALTAKRPGSPEPVFGR